MRVIKRVLLLVACLMMLLSFAVKAEEQSLKDGERAVADTLNALTNAVRLMDEKILPPLLFKVDKLERHRRNSPGAWYIGDERELSKAKSELSGPLAARNSAAAAYDQLTQYLKVYRNWDFLRSGAPFPYRIDPVK